MSDQPPPAPPTPPASPAPAPTKSGSGNKVLIIVLCCVLGFMLLIGGCAVACTYFVAKKGRELGEVAKKYPAYPALSIAASLSPDLEVVKKDPDNGRITVKNKKTGEVVTINAADYTADNVGQALERMTKSAAAAASSAPTTTASAEPAPSANPSTEPAPTASAPAPVSAAKAAAMQDMAEKLPAFAPSYPGGQTTEANQTKIGPMASSTYGFTTTDKVDAVLDFYEKKATAAGFTVLGRETGTNDLGPTGTVTLMKSSPQTSVTVTAESHEGGSLQVNVAVTSVSQ